MLSLFLLLLAISHRVLGGVQRKDTLHHDPSVNIPSQMNLTKLSEHDNVTKDALDNDVQKEEIAKDIMKKVREILAAAQEDDVTDKPKSHIEIFMDLIDNMERPLESEVPNEDDLGNTDYTEYEMRVKTTCMIIVIITMMISIIIMKMRINILAITMC